MYPSFEQNNPTGTLSAPTALSCPTIGPGSCPRLEMPQCPPGWVVWQVLAARSCRDGLPRGVPAALPISLPVSPLEFCSRRGSGCWWTPRWHHLQLFYPRPTTESHPAWKVVNVTWLKCCTTHRSGSFKGRQFLLCRKYAERDTILES